MKNIIGLLVLSTLVLSPVVVPQTVSAATASETQTMLLIQLLLEKVKTLQAELALLMKEKADPVKVEITEQNAEYKKEVGPLLDKIEEKEKAKRAIIKNLKESQCLNPYRQFKDGKVTVTCKDTNPAPIITEDTPIDSIVPLTLKSREYIEDLKNLEEDIVDLRYRIDSLKTRYGI